MSSIKKFSDYNALAGSDLRGDETLLIADTASDATLTATTISATSSTNTIADSGSGLPIVKVGALVSISGFTDTAAELNGLHIVLSSTSSELVIATDITTDESAGQSVTVSEVAAMYQVPLSALDDYLNSSSMGSNVLVNTQTGTSYTVTLADYSSGLIIEMNNASENTVTIPPNSSVAFPVGAVIPIRQLGVGVTTIAAGSGVTLLNPHATANIATQYGSATIHQRATDEWVLEGNLAAS